MRPWPALVALLLIPAAVAEPLGPPATVPDIVPGGSDGEVSLHAPHAVRSGHPVFLAIDGSAGEIVQMQFRMDGFLLWESNVLLPDSGFHPMVVTAPVAGKLVLAARTSTHEAMHEIAVDAAPRIGTDQPGLAGYPGLHVAWTTEGFRAGAQVPIAALGTQTDDQGRLLLSSWDLDGSGSTATWTLGSPAAPHAVVVPHPSDPNDRGATISAATTQQIATPPVATAQDLPECGDELALDPAPGSPAAWQRGTTIHVAHRDGGPVQYALQQADNPLLGIDATLLFRTTADDEWASLAFSPSTPGAMVLLVERGGHRCAVPFLSLPSLGEGELHTSLEATPTQGMRFDFTTRQGDLPIDASLEVRLLRLPYDDPGRLVWAGTLLAAQGDARFHAHYLEPGTYRLLVHASPRGMTGPVFSGDSLAKPIEFTIEPLDDAQAQMDAGLMPRWIAGVATEEPEPSRPAPVGWLVLGLALALAWRRP